ncbi:MAG TPA: hypothetical protein VMP00_06145 [Burkholderiales bacterium]|nr:hypothetical protein [Burkholderiales bacterium]
MKFSAGQRWLVLGALLAATLAAAVWVSERASAPGAEVVAAAESRAAPAGGPAQAVADSEAPAVGLEKLESRELGKAIRDPFATAPPRRATPRPRVETRPAPVAVAPPPPSAPPLPFVYMGKLITDGGLSVFLLQGERNLIVREGDTIDSLYRVERISDAGITVLFLPLNQRQTIVIGEPQ